MTYGVSGAARLVVPLFFPSFSLLYPLFFPLLSPNKRPTPTLQLTGYEVPNCSNFAIDIGGARSDSYHDLVFNVLMLSVGIATASSHEYFA